MAGRRNRYVSNKGRTVDWERLKAANETTVAAGNARMNARGDILGQGGRVLRTREQLDAETARAEQAAQQQNPGSQPQNMSIKRDAIPKRKAAEKYAVTEETPDPNDTVTPQEALQQAKERKKKSESNKQDEETFTPQEAAEAVNSSEQDTKESSSKSSSNKSSSDKSSGSSRKIVDSDE